jgi:hypothetical protein
VQTSCFRKNYHRKKRHDQIPMHAGFSTPKAPDQSSCDGAFAQTGSPHHRIHIRMDTRAMFERHQPNSGQKGSPHEGGFDCACDCRGLRGLLHVLPVAALTTVYGVATSENHYKTHYIKSFAPKKVCCRINRVWVQQEREQCQCCDERGAALAHLFCRPLVRARTKRSGRGDGPTGAAAAGGYLLAATSTSTGLTVHCELD